MAPSDVHVAKRVKLKAETSEKNSESTLPLGFKACQALLATTPASPVPSTPSTLTCIKTKNDRDKMRTLLDKHGFRTSVVHSPRPALSIYLDSCTLCSCDEPYIDGKEFILTMLGMHPNQNDRKRWYAVSVKKVYCLMLFCNLLRKLCPQAVQDNALNLLLTENETLCRSLVVTHMDVVDDAHRVSSTVSERVATLIRASVVADSRIRAEQLRMNLTASPTETPQCLTPPYSSFLMLIHAVSKISTSREVTWKITNESLSICTIHKWTRSSLPRSPFSHLSTAP